MSLLVILGILDLLVVVVSLRPASPKSTCGLALCVCGIAGYAPGSCIVSHRCVPQKQTRVWSQP